MRAAIIGKINPETGCYNYLVIRRMFLSGVRFSGLSRALILPLICILPVLISADPTLVGKRGYLLPGQPEVISPESLNKKDLKFVCITIDDVPEAVYTKQILEVLLKHKARATFFVNGARVKAFPETAKMITAAGHEIANHTWSHPRMTSLSTSDATAEIVNTNEIVEEICGLKPRFYRPPFGVNDARITKIASDYGLITMLWTIDTMDWKKPGVEKIRSTVGGSLHNGAVILMHGTNEQSPLALDLILGDLAKKGYATVTTTEWYRLVGGKPDFGLDLTAKEKELLETLYDRMDVEDLAGEHTQILIPKLGSEDLSLEDLKFETADATLSIYSNLKFVDSGEVPASIGARREPPPNFFRLPHNTFEIRPDGRNFLLTLTDAELPNFNPYYYPRPSLVMLAKASEFGDLNLQRLGALFKSGGFDKLIVLRDSETEPEPDLSVLPDGVSAQSLTNKMHFPVAFVEAGEGFVQKYIDLVRQKRTAVTVMVSPDTFRDNHFIANELRKFVQLRMISGVFTYDPADDIRVRWKMPAAVEIARFTANNRIIVMLFSRTSETFELVATSNDEHLEVATLDDPRNPKYAQVKAGMRLNISGEPLYLVYRWGDAAMSEMMGPG